MSIKSTIEDVERFHAAANIPNLLGNAHLVKRKLRKRLLKEEMRELTKAIRERDMVGVADGYADIVFVVLGSALMQIGKQRFIRAWGEVVRSNMDKCIEGKLTMRDDGKVLKPPGWRGPDIVGVLAMPEDGEANLDELGGEMHMALDEMRKALTEVQVAIDAGVPKEVVRDSLASVCAALDEFRRGLTEML